MFRLLLVSGIVCPWLVTAGCSKKYELQIEEQNVQLEQVGARIDELESQNAGLTDQLQEAEESLARAEREKQQLAASIEDLRTKRPKPAENADCVGRAD